jgi:hypothetical protein
LGEKYMSGGELDDLSEESQELDEEWYSLSEKKGLSGSRVGEDVHEVLALADPDCIEKRMASIKRVLGGCVCFVTTPRSERTAS